jgi:hypothetical protein
VVLYDSNGSTREQIATAVIIVAYPYMPVVKKIDAICSL